MVTASKAQRRRMIAATIRTTTANAKAWEDAGMQACAAVAYGHVEYWQAQLDELERKPGDD